MASAESQADTSQADQTLAVQGGRPPSDIRKSEFTNVGNSQNQYKRPGAKCKHCSTEISVVKATVVALRNHILSECSQVPQETAAGIDPSALAAQFLARQQQQQMLQQQQQMLQQQHLGIPLANPMMPAPGLAQQVLQQQMLLAQLQQQQQSGL
jgi:hypothetical protein